MVTKEKVFNIFFREKPAMMLVGLKNSKGAIYASSLAKQIDCTYSHVASVAIDTPGSSHQQAKGHQRSTVDRWYGRSSHWMECKTAQDGRCGFRRAGGVVGERHGARRPGGQQGCSGGTSSAEILFKTCLRMRVRSQDNVYNRFQAELLWRNGGGRSHNSCTSRSHIRLLTRVLSPWRPARHRP